MMKCNHHHHFFGGLSQALHTQLLIEFAVSDQKKLFKENGVEGKR